MVASTAYLLISHGSRDPRPQEAMNRLADLVRKHLEAELQPSPISYVPDTLQRTSLGTSFSRQTLLLREPRLAVAQPLSSEVIVGTACLELAPIPLSEQIYEFGQRLIAAGVRKLKLLPVFLISGVHVTEDIPAEVEKAEALLGKSIELTLCPHLGSHNKITEVVAKRLASAGAERALLVAHGSRKPKGNKAIRGLARRLNTAVAYWSTPPDIETQVIELMQKGCQRLTILPYFLFAGGITDAITHRTEELAERFPKISFRLLPTLGATDEIADLAVELIY
ncbi:MAG: sirohydrochlorin chelatase [Phormidesmis sp.]